MSAQTTDTKSTLKTEPEKELFTWKGPARPFKRRNRDFYITIIAIAAVFSLVFFFVEGWLPVVLIISLVFLFYVLSTVEPENVDYRLTSKGVEIAGRRSDWEVMNRFWFTKRFESWLLIIETLTFPGRLELVIDPQDKDKISKAISKYLIHEEVPPSFLDRTANWFTKRLPGNK